MDLKRAIQACRRPLEKYGLITAGTGVVLAVLSQNGGLSEFGVFLLLAGIIAGAVGSVGAWIDRRHPAS